MEFEHAYLKKTRIDKAHQVNFHYKLKFKYN